MKKAYSPAWKASTQTRKQRKFRYNAPLHVRGKFLAAHLAKELREKHKKRSLRVRTGDTVRVLRGEFKGREGKVDRVDLSKGRLFIAKVERIKPDGATKVQIGFSASNVMLVELDKSDKKRLS
ncbi:MAG: 50S ribosomal protein L24 [Candidatus Woesearchaeota archaeon]|nr:50S ribosomal protein L24 [Candidatus Woesearchaeota archaeon]